MRIISGSRKGGKLFEVESNDTRSTTDRVKESIFNLIGPYFNGGVCLDFFSGSGSLCIEALSRGMDYAFMFDVGSEQITVIKKNLAKFDFTNNSLVKQVDYKNAFSSINQKVDLVFLDPPYKKGYVDDVLKLFGEKNVLNSSCQIVCEVEHDEFVNYEGYKLVTERVYGRVKIIILEVMI